jgi:hypothetical protein
MERSIMVSIPNDLTLDSIRGKSKFLPSELASKSIEIGSKIEEVHELVQKTHLMISDNVLRYGPRISKERYFLLLDIRDYEKISAYLGTLATNFLGFDVLTYEDVGGPKLVAKNPSDGLTDKYRGY